MASSYSQDNKSNPVQLRWTPPKPGESEGKVECLEEGCDYCRSVVKKDSGVYHAKKWHDGENRGIRWVDKKPPMTPAQRTAKCRAKQKAKKMMEVSHIHGRPWIVHHDDQA